MIRWSICKRCDWSIALPEFFGARLTLPDNPFDSSVRFRFYEDDPNGPCLQSEQGILQTVLRGGRQGTMRRVSQVFRSIGRLRLQQLVRAFFLFWSATRTRVVGHTLAPCRVYRTQAVARVALPTGQSAFRFSYPRSDRGLA